jgi:hypothetical protein
LIRSVFIDSIHYHRRGQDLPRQLLTTEGPVAALIVLTVTPPQTGSAAAQAHHFLYKGRKPVYV